MALQGTIKDFGLGEIFQLIGIQRKTGVLTLENGEDTVTIKFVDGQIVGADTKSRSVEELLGSVLVRTGRITEAQLQAALRLQRRTLQRLGHVLVKSNLISVDDLVEALRVQSLQIIYRLFRWRNGSYHFHRVENVEYDEKHFVPIRAETILMEGARMVDEWPIIERRIKSDRMIFRPTAAAQALNLDVESIVDRDIEIDLGFAERDLRSSGGHGHGDAKPRLSGEERDVLALVDGRRTVCEIVECSTLGEFDTCRILAELVTRELIEEVRKGPAAGSSARRVTPWVDRALRWALTAAVFGLVSISLLTLPANPLSPWKVAGEQETSRRLLHYVSQSRLERLEGAIQIFYLDAGSFPDRLELVARAGYVGAEDLLDPWGRPYGYSLGPGGFRIFGFDADGEPDPRLSSFHRFTGLQRMMTLPEAAAPAAPAEAPGNAPDPEAS